MQIAAKNTTATCGKEKKGKVELQYVSAYPTVLLAKKSIQKISGYGFEAQPRSAVYFPKLKPLVTASLASNCGCNLEESTCASSPINEDIPETGGTLSDIL